MNENISRILQWNDDEMTRPLPPKSFRYLVTGGGTGGHVYPGLALADFIREREPESEFLYVGANGGAEERIVPARGYPLRTLPVRGLPAGRTLTRYAAVFLTLIRSLLQAVRIIFAYKPDVIIGTGGYASAPVLLAASVLRALRAWHGILAVHEQNIVPGRFNLWVHRRLDFMGVSFPETLRYFPGQKACVTGYPLRREMQRESLIDPAKREQDRSRLGIPAGARMLLCFGGSSGARNINRVLLEALPKLLARKDLYIFHATGFPQGTYDPEAEARQACAKIPDSGDLQQRYQRQSFYDHLDLYYRAADLVVSRSGAGSLWEIAASEKPAILVPKANLPGDHQVKNARFLERHGRVRVLYETRKPGRPPSRGEQESIDAAEFLRDVGSLLDATAPNGPKSQATIPLSRGAMRFYEVLLALRGASSAPRSAAPAPCAEAREPGRRQESSPGIEWLSDSQMVSFLENRRKAREALPEEDRRYVRSRVDQLLCSPRWERRNLGVKLAGLVRYRQELPFLLACISDRTPAPLLHRLLGGDFREVGFVRRNALQALWRFHEYSPEIRQALLRALQDPYFEVRSWAARAACLLSEFIGRDPELEGLLRENLRDRRFEVVVFSLEPLGKLSCDPGLISELLPLLEHRNWKIQEAALRCLTRLAERKVIALTEQIDRELQRIPMKGQDFLPQFPLEKTWESFLRRRPKGTEDAHEPNP